MAIAYARGLGSRVAFKNSVCLPVKRAAKKRIKPTHVIHVKMREKHVIG